MPESTPSPIFFNIPGDTRIAAARTLATDLLGKAGFKAVLIQRPVKKGAGAPPALVAHAADLKDANPFVGAMPVNAGGVVAKMTKVEAFPEKTAVFLRPCESRALVELVKLKQADLSNVLVVGVDCPGTYLVKEYGEKASPDPEADLEARLSGKAEGLRDPCRFCVHPQAPFADLRLAVYGSVKGAFVEALTEAGHEAADALGYGKGEPASRSDALQKAQTERHNAREESQEGFRNTVTGREGVLEFLSKCLNCQNCRGVCPVCYCKECFFDSPTFDLEARKFLGWASARGSLRMPADTMLFHLTRLNHMVHSCINCGMCSQACPSGIEVGLLFSVVGRRVQSMFDYDPGASPDDDIPLSTFRENELEVFGGK